MIELIQNAVSWWRDDFSVGRIRAGIALLFTSVPGMRGPGDPATPGLGRALTVLDG